MGDYISREDLINDIKNNLWLCTIDDITASTALKQTITDIKNQPSVDVTEVKHAHWITVRKVEPAYDITGVKTWADEVMCSKCGFTTWNIEGRNDWNLCPRCGAKIDRGQGCRGCPHAPETYEEFCIVKNRVKYGEHAKLIEKGLCPDAFSDVSPLCGAYNKTWEEIKNED